MQIVFWLFPLTYNETTMGPAGYYSRYCLQHKYGKVGCQIQHIRASPQWGVRKRIIPHSSNHEVDLNASVFAGKATWCCSCTREGPYSRRMLLTVWPCALWQPAAGQFAVWVIIQSWFASCSFLDPTPAALTAVMHGPLLAPPCSSDPANLLGNECTCCHLKNWGVQPN